VVEVKERPGGSSSIWTIRSETTTPTAATTTSREEEFDFVVIAQGHYSRNDIRIPWEGIADFKEQGDGRMTYVII
jgi:cation diffusion facilitator CzcD-associated flavoprotein CzcO